MRAPNWYDPAIGTHVHWFDGCTAVFAGAGGTVTISSSVNPTSVAVNANGYTISVAASQVTISGGISGSHTLTVSGSGTLVLQGQNVLSGVTIDSVNLDVEGSLSGTVTTVDNGHVYQNQSTQSLSISDLRVPIDDRNGHHKTYKRYYVSGEPIDINADGATGGLTQDGADGLVELHGTVTGVPDGSLATVTVKWSDTTSETYTVVAGKQFTITYNYENADLDNVQEVSSYSSTCPGGQTICYQTFSVICTVSCGNQSYRTAEPITVVDEGPTTYWSNVTADTVHWHATAFADEPGEGNSFTYHWQVTGGDWTPIYDESWNSTFDFTAQVYFGLTLTVTDQLGAAREISSSFGGSLFFSPTDSGTLSITEEDPGAKVVEGSLAHFRISMPAAVGSFEGTPTCLYEVVDGSGKAVEDYCPVDSDDLGGAGSNNLPCGSHVVSLDHYDYTTQCYYKDICIPTTANAVDESGETFSVVIRDVYVTPPSSYYGDVLSEYGDVKIGDSNTATATIVHPLSTDADNNSQSGMPDGALKEAQFKDVSPGKIIAVQKFETGENGSLTGTLDPNTRLVPITVTLPTLPTNSTATLSCDPELNLWYNSNDLGTFITIDASSTPATFTYYVEALKAGQFKIDLRVNNSFSDEALFTAVDDQSRQCNCCNSGTSADHNGQLVQDQSFLGGLVNVVSTSLSQALSELASVFATYSDSSPYSSDYLAANPSLGQTTSVGDQPYLVLAGNAVVVVNGSGLQIWDFVSSNSSAPWEPRENYICDTNGTEVQVSFDQGTMKEDGDNFVETDPDGTKWTFSGTTGKLSSMTPPGGGGSVTYFYNETTGLLDHTTTSTGAGHSQYAVYSYSGGQVTGVTIRKDSTSGATIESAEYVYYGHDVPYDPSGDGGKLQTVTTRNASGDVTDTTYYRYYTDSNYDTMSSSADSSAEIGRLKFVFNTASLNRMTAAGIDYLTAPDSAVAQYADQYLQYSSDGSGSVISNTVQGSGTTTYSNYTNTSTGTGDNPNVWTNEQVEVQSSNGTTTTTTTFYNYRGDVLLTEVSADGQKQDTYNVYDSNGHLIESAHPSAILSCSITDGSGYYPNLNWNSGLIDVYTYYPSNPSPQASTTTSGGVPGQLYQTFAADGGNEASNILAGNVPSDAALQSTTDYIESPGGAFFTSHSTTYSQPGGASPEITTYLYKFNGDAIVSEATILPAVTSSQHGYALTGLTATTVSGNPTVAVSTGGPVGLAQGSWVEILGGPSAYDGFYQVANVTASSFTYVLPAGASSTGNITVSMQAVSGSQVGYNSYGQEVWSQDASGSISYTQYDAAAGATTEAIQDVNFSGGVPVGVSSSDYTLLTALGWALPPAGGKNLTTAYLVDSQGRTVRETDPAGNVTWTVYNDANHETRTFPGWHSIGSGHYQTTGPVSVSRDDSSGGYSESLTYSWTDANGLPTTTATYGGVQYTVPTWSSGDLATMSAVIQSLSRSLTNSAGQVYRSLQYTSMPTSGYSLSTADFGQKGQNYLETDTFYDDLGRTEATIDPAGAIDYTVYDGFGRAMDQWKGTVPATNGYAADQAIVSAFRNWVYNSANANARIYSATGVSLYRTSHSAYDGNGSVIESDTYVDPSGVVAPSATYYVYDWQSRQVITVNPADAEGRVTYSLVQYNNASEATETQQYWYEGGDSTALTAAINAARIAAVAVPLSSSDLLLAQSTAAYDSLGQVYETSTFKVQPQTVQLAYNSVTQTATVVLANHGFHTGDTVQIAGADQTEFDGQFAITKVDDNTFTFSVVSSSVPTGTITAAPVNPAPLVSNTWYDSRGNVVKYQPAGSNTYTFSQYDSAGRLVAEYVGTDMNTGYPNLSNIVGTATVYQQTEYQYDPDGNQIFTVTRQRAANYGGTGALTGDPSESRSSYTANWYDKAGRQIVFANYGTVAPGGQEQRPSSMPSQNSSAMVTTTVYNDVAHTVVTTDPLGRSAYTAYDVGGRVTTEIQNYVSGGTAADQNSTTQILYNQLGQVYKTIDPDMGSHFTTYSYDAFGRLQQVVAPSPGGTTTYAYDLQAETTAVTDPLGRVTTTSYDASGRTIATATGSIAAQSSSTWSFTQLSPNAARSYTLYVQYPSSNPNADYHVTDGSTNGLTIIASAAAQPLGAGWYALGTVTVPSTDDGTAIHVTYVGTPPGSQSVCLVQQNSATAYTVEGQVYTTTDALNHSTTYAYDGYGRQKAVTDANNSTTSYAHYANGDLQSETDPDHNVTTYYYDALDRVYQEVTPTGTITTAYDGGNVSAIVDADGRTTQYTYDQFNRRSGEYWYGASVTPLADRSNAYEVLSTSYDLDGELLIASDTASSPFHQSTDSYVYDGLGRVKADSQWSTGMGTQSVTLSSQYDSAGNRTQLSANIGGSVNSTTGQVSGGTADFVNTYQYYANNAMQQVSQSGVAGGNSVASKFVSFTYFANGQFQTITRYAGADSTAAVVATSTYGYDGTGRLTSLTHVKGATTFAAYGWTYNADGTVATFSNASHTNENASYAYDATGQLLGATYNDTSLNTSYGYDANGNQNTGGYVVSSTGANEISSDGTYNYYYDAAGNLTSQVGISNGAETDYAYDNRNRLTAVTQKQNGVIQQVVSYGYDVLNRLVSRTVTAYSGGSPGTPQRGHFVYDGNNIVLELDGSCNVTKRVLNGPAVDQVLAQETPSATVPVTWALGDNQGTVRDLVQYSGGTATLAEHRTYDAFGKPLSTASVDFLFGYTGKYYDSATKLQWNLNRWYNPQLRRWMSQDPSGLGPDANPYRYCGNAPVVYVDPNGLWRIIRRDRAKALVISQEGDSVDTLAKGVGLDAGSYKDWLSLTNAGESGVGKFLRYYHAQAADAIPSSSSEILHCFRAFEVPNTIYQFWCGEGGIIGRRLVVEWQKDAEYLEGIGFKVIMRANETEPFKSSQEFADVMGQLSAAKELHGLVVYGHGADDHFGTGSLKKDANGNKSGSVQKSSSRLSVEYANIDNSLKYKLGFVLINACASKDGAASLTSANGISFGFKGMASPVDSDTSSFFKDGKTEEYHIPAQDIRAPQEGTEEYWSLADPWW